MSKGNEISSEHLYGTLSCGMSSLLYIMTFEASFPRRLETIALIRFVCVCVCVCVHGAAWSIYGRNMGELINLG